MDEASQALFADFSALKGRMLLIADEGFSEDTIIPEGIEFTVITNRYDLATFYSARNRMVYYSDFDFSAITEGSIDTVLFRLSKSKILTEYLLNQIRRLLRVDGCMILTGNNDEGIKRVIRQATCLIGAQQNQQLLGKGLRYAVIQRTHETQITELDAGGKYHHSMIITTDESLNFYSKPGVYGVNKIDAGSQFLVAVIKTFCRKNPQVLLDLGCGYGYLAVMLGLHFKASVVATDNNAAAITMCAANLKAHSVAGYSMADDCGAALADHSWDLIVCNPPFHQGFNTDKTLTVKFLAAFKRLLKPGGEAWVVMNRFIAVEGLLKQHSLAFEMIAENGAFKVIRITR